MQEHIRDFISKVSAWARETAPGIPWVFLSDYTKAGHPIDTELLEAVIHALNSAKSKNERRAFYYIVGQLAREHKDWARGGAVLIAGLERERDKDILSGILDLLADIPQPPDANWRPILRFLADSKSWVRHEAIQALARCPAVEAETALLEVAAHTQDRYDLLYVTRSLFAVGGERSVEYLRRACFHANQDIAWAAIVSLAKIAGAREQGLFVRILETGHWISKWPAMAAIANHGDERTIEPVIRRIKVILSRKRKTETLGKTELLLGLNFLAKWRASDPQVRRVFEELLPRKADYVLPEERTEVDKFLAKDGAS